MCAFLEEMNIRAKELCMKGSFFDSPHGLNNVFNRSTASDISKLGTVAMQNPLFRRVVATKRFVVMKKENSRGYRWDNTNKLLAHKGYVGMKTGITFNAGPCLSTCIEKDGFTLIVTLLNSKSMDNRWMETQKLVSWAIGRLTKITKFANEYKGDVEVHTRLLSRVKHL